MLRLSATKPLINHKCTSFRKSELLVAVVLHKPLVSQKNSHDSRSFGTVDIKIAQYPFILVVFSSKNLQISNNLLISKRIKNYALVK